MDKVIRQRIGLVCTCCGRRVVTHVNHAFNMPAVADESDFHIWINPKDINVACDRCGYKMMSCDPDLVRQVSALIQRRIVVQEATTARYRLYEFFDGRDGEDTGAYYADMSDEDASILINLEGMPLENAVAFLNTVCDVAMEMDGDHRPEMKVTRWLRSVDGSDSCIQKCESVEEYQELKEILAEDRDVGYGLVAIYIRWPESWENYDTLNIARDINRAFTRGFLDVIVSRYKKPTA